MHEQINSLTNQKIKNVVKLRDRKHRDESRLTIVEGHKEVLRAIEAEVEIAELYVFPEFIDKFDNQQIIDILEEQKVPIYLTSEEVFSKIAYGDRNEGVIAICKQWDVSIGNLEEKENGLYVVAEGVEKPGNFGAILRTCDGAGVDGVIVANGNIDIFNPNVIRASLGAIFFVRVFVCSNQAALECLRGSGVKICATLPLAEKVYSNTDLTGSIAIVIGCEHSGLTQFWVDNSDLKVKIPMRGEVDSLNVSSSTAVVIYEAIRQRG